jgi:hypothetical protein
MPLGVKREVLKREKRDWIPAGVYPEWLEGPE